MKFYTLRKVNFLMVYFSDGIFFVPAQSLKLAFWGHRGHFGGPFKGFRK